MKGYAKQALSDLEARNALAKAKAHKCHRLHFLQMAAEKICKAHMIREDRRDREIKSHACVQKNLPQIARNLYADINASNKTIRRKIAVVKHFANEIELLAPACDLVGHRKDNSEYPWDDGSGRICVPCEYSFPNIDDEPEKSPAFALLLKLLLGTAKSYSR